MFWSLYTKGQAQKFAATVSKSLPPNGKSVVFPRPQAKGGGLVRIAPSGKKTKGGPLYKVEILTEQELQKYLEVA